MNWYDEQKNIENKQNGAGILFMSSGKILLGLRGKNISHPGEWSVPGGKVSKKDKNYWETAERETLEELGFMPEDFLQKTIMRNVNKSGRTYLTFVLEVDDNFIEHSLKLFRKNKEFEQIKWFDLDFLPYGMHPKTLKVIEEYRSTHD